MGLFVFAYMRNVEVIDQSTGFTKSSVKINDTEIKVDVAHSAEEKLQGLSGRESLLENTGMLFTFDHPGRYVFWMKDMNFPIDIIWIGADRQVVHIEHNVRPESYPENFAPTSNALYVLEVESGFSKKHNFKIGDPVFLQLN